MQTRIANASKENPRADWRHEDWDDLHLEPLHDGATWREIFMERERAAARLRELKRRLLRRR
jgi:hypothetical protein